MKRNMATEIRRGFVSSSLLFLYWSFLLYFTCTTTTNAAPIVGEPCDLACWLNFTIAIPDQSFSDLGFNFSIIQMTCRRNQIGGINSTFSPPTTLGVLLFGIGTTCNAGWQLRDMNWPYVTLSGAVEADVSSSSLYLQMMLTKGPDGLATEASVLQCSTSVQVTSLTFTGDASTVLQYFENSIKTELQKQLDSISCTELKSLINVNLTTALQEVDVLIQPYLEPRPVPSPLIPQDTLELRDNPLVNLVSYALHGLLGPNGLLYINKLADKFTNGTGSISIPSEWLQMATITIPVSASAGNLTFGLSAVAINGLNTWGAVDLYPVSNYSMGIHTEMDLFNLTVTFFVNVTAPWIDQYLYEEAELIIVLSHNNLNSTMQVALNSGVVNTLEPGQLESIGCLRSAINGAALLQLFVNMTVDQVSIIALNGNLEKDLDATINNVLALFTTSFGPAIPAFVNSFGASTAMKEVNNLIDAKLATINETCEPATTSSTFSEIGTIASFSGAGLLFVLISAIIIFTHPKLKKEKHTELEIEPLVASVKSNSAPCLAMDPQIPVLVRYIIPLFLLINIAMFISSNASTGASIYLIFTLGETEIRSPSLFNFSLANTIRDMWHAKVYPLALLIAVFSGAWPYLKLLLMLFCWLTPVRLLKVKKREWLLMMLDTLGKWSLIDAFVLTLMVVAFRFHIAYPFVSDGVQYDPVVNVFVVPDWGFYSFLMATMLSLVLTHIVLAFHHSSSTAAPKEQTVSINTERKPLSGRSFRSNKTNFTCTTFGKYIIFLLLLISACLLAFGAYIDSFDFEFRGSAGFVLEAVGENPKTNYSVITLGTALPKSSETPNAPGIRWIQATYFTFTMGVPLSHLVVLIFLWLVPMKQNSQRQIFVITEILNAWSAMEVFVVSIIAAVLEIQQFAKFIIGDRCDLINEILKKYFHNEFGQGDVCFDVVATLSNGCWILFAACVIYLFAGNMVMRICHNALQEHKNQSINSHSSIQYEGKPQKKRGFFVLMAKSLRFIKEEHGDVN